MNLNGSPVDDYKPMYSFLFTLYEEGIYLCAFNTSHTLFAWSKSIQASVFNFFTTQFWASLSHDSPSSIYQAVITICSICSPCSRLSHLVNPKGEACRCTTTSLNPLPLFISLPPLLSVVVAVQTTPESSATPPSPEHKGRIYQYVLVTFRGQCCCSWITEVQLCISRSLGVSAF